MTIMTWCDLKTRFRKSSLNILMILMEFMIEKYGEQ